MIREKIMFCLKSQLQRFSLNMAVAALKNLIWLITEVFLEILTKDFKQNKFIPDESLAADNVE